MRSDAWGGGRVAFTRAFEAARANTTEATCSTGEKAPVPHECRNLARERALANPTLARDREDGPIALIHPVDLHRRREQASSHIMQVELPPLEEVLRVVVDLDRTQGRAKIEKPGQSIERGGWEGSV